MTVTSNARIAGFTYLVYIAVAFPAMVLFGRATGAEGTPAKLARIAEHAGDVRIVIILTLLSCFAALILGVTLYRITREQDPDLALLAFACRVAEGIAGAGLVIGLVALLRLATGPDATGSTAVAGFLLDARGWNTTVSATFFAVGSLLFSWLLLRGRSIPVPLASLGVAASAVVVIGLPLELIGLIVRPVTDLMWLPMAAFEIPLGFWLIVKGVRTA